MVCFRLNSPWHQFFLSSCFPFTRSGEPKSVQNAVTIAVPSAGPERPPFPAGFCVQVARDIQTPGSPQNQSCARSRYLSGHGRSTIFCSTPRGKSRTMKYASSVTPPAAASVKMAIFSQEAAVLARRKATKKYTRAIRKPAVATPRIKATML